MAVTRNLCFGLLILLLALKWDTLHVISVDLGSVQIAHPVVNPHGICATFVLSTGYDCAEFLVPTKDGFLLSVQSMSNPRFRNAHKEPAFLYHGIFQGGEAWLLDEPRESLAFFLANSGYEVWIGSSRTANFSYGHIIYNRNQKEFWDWSFDDLVAYDLPAMLYFVNNMTRQPIYYVGHSQGAQTAFAAFTYKEIASLVKKAAMLGPVSYVDKIPSPLIRTAAFLFLDEVDFLLLQMYEFNPASPEVRLFLRGICGNAEPNCEDLISQLLSGPTCCVNESRIAYYNDYRQSSATRNIVQLSQLLRSGRFGKYDYGFFGNLAKYWSIFPPSYDLSAIPKRLSFFLAYGGRDELADLEDVRHLVSKLPGEVKLLFKHKYGHADFIRGTTSWVDIFPSLLEFFR